MKPLSLVQTGSISKETPPISIFLIWSIIFAKSASVFLDSLVWSKFFKRGSLTRLEYTIFPFLSFWIKLSCNAFSSPCYLLMMLLYFIMYILRYALDFVWTRYFDYPSSLEALSKSPFYIYFCICGKLN